MSSQRPPREGGDPARRLALRVLARLERADGRAVQGVLREVFDGPDVRQLDERDRGLAAECIFGVLRWRIRLDSVLSRLVTRGLPDDPELLNVLRLGAFQILFLDRVPPHAAVHATVELAKAIRGEPISKFVNGVLRSLERTRPPPRDLAERWSHPTWMVERLMAELKDPGAVEARLEANMRPAPVSLRLHPNTSESEVPEGRPSGVPGVIMAPGDAAPIREGTRLGKWLPQDAASARVVRQLDVQPGDRVLELCAGRGVKSSQIATALGPEGRLLALDAAPNKLAAAVRLVRRWAPNARADFIAADASTTLPLDPTLRFNRILVDAPCSGLGVIRRRPETLWRRRPEDIVDLAALQKRILAEALRWLAPGGTLIYAVCTTTPEETTQVVAPYFVHETIVTSPERDGMDGFFIARVSA